MILGLDVSTRMTGATVMDLAGKMLYNQVPRGQNSKIKSFEFVLDNEPSFVVEYTKKGNLKPGVTDRSDSWIIARAGLNFAKTKKHSK